MSINQAIKVSTMEGCCGSKPEQKQEKEGCCMDEAQAEKKCCKGEGECACKKEGKKCGEGDCSDSSSPSCTNPKDQHIQDLTSTLQRLQADFENFRKRSEKMQQEFIKFASKNMIVKLLPTVENFDLAMNNTENQKEFTKGVKLIHKQMHDLMKSEGVEQIPAKEGQAFDPNLHEAMMTGEGKKKNSILQVLAPGYTMHGQVIRPAKVKVAK